MEGTGSYGASLARALRLEGIEVIEVTRAARVGARHRGKNDTRDAEAAARSVLSGQATAIPKTHDGIVESIRVLRNTRAGAVKARVQAIVHLKNLVAHRPRRATRVAARPDDQAARRALRTDASQRSPATRCTQHVMPCARSPAATRHSAPRSLSSTRCSSDLTAKAAPRLLRQPGIGPETAARLLLVAGDNPTRLRNDAALAALCGASPIEASSGNTTRHRLNRGGDRQANSALWLIANNRMTHDPTTRAYVTRRTAEGKSTKEIRRCLMRHIARSIYPLLIADLHRRTGSRHAERHRLRATAR